MPTRRAGSAGGSDEWTEESESEEDSLPTRRWGGWAGSAHAAREMVKPVFVKKTERATMEERAIIEQEEERLVQQTQSRQEERKEQSKELLKKDVELRNKVKDRPDFVYNVLTDDDDEEQAYDLWRLRWVRRR